MRVCDLCELLLGQHLCADDCPSFPVSVYKPGAYEPFLLYVIPDYYVDYVEWFESINLLSLFHILFYSSIYWSFILQTYFLFSFPFLFSDVYAASVCLPFSSLYLTLMPDYKRPDNEILNGWKLFFLSNKSCACLPFHSLRKRRGRFFLSFLVFG